MTLLTNATILLPQTYHSIDKSYAQNYDIQPRIPIELPHEEGFEIQDSDLQLSINDIIHDSDNESYRIIDLIGVGSFSKVYKCEVVKKPGLLIALKISRNIPRLVKRLENEFNVISKLQKGNDVIGINSISRVYKFFHFSGHACVTMELYQRSLLDHLNYHSEILSFVRSIMFQLLHALSHIHSHGLSHCDIKSDNIMMTSEGSFSIRLIDFGNAQKLNGARVKLTQPDIYRSPEAHLGLGLTSAIDIWAAGCVAAELVLGFPLFAFETPEDVITAIDGLVGPIPQKMLAVSLESKRFFMQTTHGYTTAESPQHVILERHINGDMFVEGNLAANLHQRLAEFPEGDSCIDFILGLLNPDPDERLTADKALQHPFMSDDKDLSKFVFSRRIKVGVIGSSVHIVPQLSPINKNDFVF
jgi:dual specificity protein kinase YAK1